MPTSSPDADGSARAEVVLVSNGPGELYTWVRPVLADLRERRPDLRVTICLIPCQFASGSEAGIARTFGADRVSTPGAFLRAAALGRSPEGIGTAARGIVVALGGNAAHAVALGRRLGYPAVRYAFEPGFPDGLERLFVRDATTATRAVRRGAPRERVEVVGNLVADAVQQGGRDPAPGNPHVLLFGGSRDGFSRVLLPLVFGIADRLGESYPEARFVWPVSALLSEATIADAIAGRGAAIPGSVACRRSGDRLETPRGTVIEMVPEADRYRHMGSADLAVTIPGTNTLELGIAGVPTVVVLPLNRPESIPLEGLGHWIGLLPLVGGPLKRALIRTFVQVRGLRRPISLPNRMSGESLFEEISGDLDADAVAARCRAWLDDPERRDRVRERLAETMPAPGAAARLVDRILAVAEIESDAVPGASAHP